MKYREKDIEIIYEDSDLLVVNKPYGLVVNSSHTTKEETLQDFLAEYLKISLPDTLSSSTSQDFADVFMVRMGMAHRLDKDTSGVLLVGKTPESLQNLMAQFKSREVGKNYIALTHGEIKNPLIDIQAPIGRNPKNRFRFAVTTEGKHAHTTIEVLKVSPGYTVVSVSPKTGRTHQIRVHLGAINHPVVGDVLYAPRGLLEADQTKFGRLMLHARSIQCLHPTTGEKVTFEATIPSEFENYL